MKSVAVLGCLAVLFFGLGSEVLGWVFLCLCGIKLLNAISFALPRRLALGVYWIHSSVFEVFAWASILVLRPFAYLWRLKVGKDGGEPILLVHGFMHDSMAWLYLKGRLVRAGFGPIYLLNLKHPFLPLSEYVKRVEKRAQEIEAETGRSDLILIGHSMGGLVSSMYATSSGAGRVTDVIAIGSPFYGTHMAKLAFGPGARDMERGSSVLKELIPKMGQSKTRFYHIASTTDQIIIPFDSAIVGSNEERQFLVHDIGHVSLLCSLRVSRKIQSWLTEGTSLSRS